jgi:hypothetical protein
LSLSDFAKQYIYCSFKDATIEKKRRHYQVATDYIMGTIRQMAEGLVYHYLPSPPEKQQHKYPTEMPLDILLPQVVILSWN